MKELSIEEKAKAYDEALERAKDFIKGEVHYALRKGENIMCWIFPELRESEDELAWLKKYIEEEAYSLSMDIRDNEDRIKLTKLQKALAWLEKQGEQKSADSYCQENCKGFQETGKCFADGDCKSKREAESIDKAEPKFKDWDLFQIPEKEVADEWDGHTPQEAAERLHKYLQRKL